MLGHKLHYCAAAVGALSNIFGFGAKANVVSILSQLGVIDGARKVDEDGNKGARYTSQELIDLATKPDEFGRTLSNKIDLEDRNSDKSSKLALGPKEQAKEKAYQTQRNANVPYKPRLLPILQRLPVRSSVITTMTFVNISRFSTNFSKKSSANAWQGFADESFSCWKYY